MDEVTELTNFYSAIEDDHRIGPSHISVYMALFQLYNLNHFQNPIRVTRSTVMAIAKISGVATYHKCIKQLVASGYIYYQPSYNPAIGSEIHLIVTNQDSCNSAVKSDLVYALRNKLQNGLQ